jgi:hypothetical protein
MDKTDERRPVATVTLRIDVGLPGVTTNRNPCELDPTAVDPTAAAGRAALAMRDRVVVSSTTIRAPPVLSDTTNAIWVEPIIAVPAVAAVSSASIGLVVKTPLAVSRRTSTPPPAAFTPIAQCAELERSITQGEAMVVQESIEVDAMT